MFTYTFFVYAFTASIFIAILCPIIGIFLVLRKHSFIGDTLSHSALAGVTLALAFHTMPLIGAFLFTSFCGFLIEAIRPKLKGNNELVLSVVLTLSVGIAITLISSNLVHANAESFLFGSILTVSLTDIIIVIALSLVAITTFLSKYHELLYLIVDEDLAKVSGVNVKLINYLFSLLVSITISVSIKIVGMMVLGSLLTMPVAAALQFKKGFKKTLLISVFFSLAEILAALVCSYYFNAAPGGLIAIFSVIGLILAIFWSKARE